MISAFKEGISELKVKLSTAWAQASRIAIQGKLEMHVLFLFAKNMLIFKQMLIKFDV